MGHGGSPLWPCLAKPPETCLTCFWTHRWGKMCTHCLFSSGPLRIIPHTVNVCYNRTYISAHQKIFQMLVSVKGDGMKKMNLFTLFIIKPWTHKPALHTHGWWCIRRLLGWGGLCCNSGGPEEGGVRTSSGLPLTGLRTLLWKSHKYFSGSHKCRY